MGSTRRSFTPEYQKDAVALIVDGGHTIVEVAKKLEISETSIRKWVKRFNRQRNPFRKSSCLNRSGPSWPGFVKTTRNWKCSSSSQKKSRPGSRKASSDFRWHRGLG